MSNVCLSFYSPVKDTKNASKLPNALRKHFEAIVQEHSDDLLLSMQNHNQVKDSHLIRREERVQSIQLQLDTFISDCLSKIQAHSKEPLQPLEQAELEEVIQEKLNELQRQFTPILVDMEEHRVECMNQKKWLGFGFPEEALVHQPDCVQFVMQSTLGYSIEMFKNTTRLGMQRHQIFFDGKEVYLRFDGTFQPWSVIKELVSYDRVKKAIVSCADCSQTYNYISPRGLVLAKRHPAELYPIEELDATEHSQIRAHAQKFWQRHAEIDPGIEKECVLQVVTANKNCLPTSWYTESLNKLMPLHTAIRLIDKEGKVYSFGIDLTEEFNQYVRDNPLSILATGFSKAVTPDFEETRTFEERAVTSIPITASRLMAILQRVKEINQGPGMRFCMTKQNCNKFGVMLLDLAGITVNTRTTFSEILTQALPPLEKVPHIGWPLWWLKDKIESVVAPIFHTINQFTPAPIKWVVNITFSVLFFIPRKVGALFFNTIIIVLGGAKMAQEARPDLDKNESMHDRHVIYFSSVITWWGDFFDDEKAECNHSYKLAQWQREQASTDLYRRSQLLKMQLLPLSVATH